MTRGLEFKRLLGGATVMAVVFALGVAASELGQPETDGPRVFLLLRALPVTAIAVGTFVGTRQCDCGRVQQGVASFVINWLMLALLFIAADRITGENVGFDAGAYFVTTAPMWILGGVAGVAAAPFTERRSRRVPSQGQFEGR